VFAPLAPERRRQRDAQLVSDLAPIAARSPVVQNTAKLRLGTGLNSRAAMHDSVRSAKRCPRASEENDVDKRPRIAGAAHTTRASGRHHGPDPSREITPFAKFLEERRKKTKSHACAR
jgi:hypothetical protein